MKYVFHNVFWSSNAPKAADEIIELLKRTSGSEMMKGFFPSFLEIIKEIIDAANAKGRHAKLMMSHNRMVEYTDHKEHGQISIYQKGKWGQKDVARINYIEVNHFWTYTADKEENLVMCHLGKYQEYRQNEYIESFGESDKILRKMVRDIKSGVPVEEVADKYVNCATPELRKQLIDGMKAIVEKGGNV